MSTLPVSVNSIHFDRLSKILDEEKVSGKIIHGGHRNRDQLKIAPTILLGPTAPTLPFGGVGENGIGAYHGKLSFDAFSHKNAVIYRGFKADAALRYPPYTAWNLSLLKALMSGSLVSIISLLFGWSKNFVAKPKVA